MSLRKDFKQESSSLRGAQQRCENPKNSQYKNYGARGIIVCEEWKGIGGFNRFLGHIGPRPSSFHSIDRINNDGNYEPGNVRWATPKEQASNREYPTSKYGNLYKKAIEVGINPKTLYTRICRLGWSFEKSITQSVRKKSK